MIVDDLFDVFYGTDLELNRLKKTKFGINFVSRTSRNNGVSAIVESLKNIKPLEAGLVTVAGGGSVMSSFVQNKPFYSGRDILCLRSKKQMSLSEKLFYCLCLRENAYKFSYGRQANKTLKLLKLPDTIPSWVYKNKMNDLIEIKESHIKNKKFVLNSKDWKKFKISELFMLGVINQRKMIQPTKMVF